MNRIFHIYLICQLRPFPASYLPRGYQPSAFQPLVCIPAKCKFFPRFPTNKKDMLLSSEYNKIHITKEINVDIQRWSESQVQVPGLHSPAQNFIIQKCTCRSFFIVNLINHWSWSELCGKQKLTVMWFKKKYLQHVERKINNISLISKYHYHFPLTNFVT